MTLFPPMSMTNTFMSFLLAGLTVVGPPRWRGASLLGLDVGQPNGLCAIVLGLNGTGVVDSDRRSRRELAEPVATLLDLQDRERQIEPRLGLRFRKICSKIRNRGGRDDRDQTAATHRAHVRGT